MWWCIMVPLNGSDIQLVLSSWIVPVQLSYTNVRACQWQAKRGLATTTLSWSLNTGCTDGIRTVGVL